MTVEKNEPVARTAMLIRRPIDEVWQALTDPAVTARFWYSDGEGKLDRAGARARWTWGWYGFTAEAVAVEVDPARRLRYDWGTPGDRATRVEYRLRPVGSGTFVEIDSWNFAGSEAERKRAAIDSTEGFTFMVCGLKAWLEHGIELGLVADRFPKEDGDTKAPDHVVRIPLELPAPPDVVYRAWTDPEWLRRWFGDHVEADVRPGGRYRAENNDGDTVYVQEGEYLALDPGRLVRATFRVPGAHRMGRTFSDEYIEARLEATPDGTRLHFANGWNGDPIDQDSEAAVRAAWKEWLGKLAETL